MVSFRFPSSYEKHQRWMSALKISMLRWPSKTNGIEFEVRGAKGGAHRGDLILTKTGLEWCEGRVRAGNGVKITWDEFINWINS